MSDEELPEAWLEAADGRQWPLNANCPIGRSPSNQIVIEDRKVSRRHAVVHRQDVDEYWLVDLGSGNGSYVNGLRVALPARLNDGDIMSLGDFALTFRQVAREEDDKSVALPSKTVIEVKNVDCWLLLADIIGSTRLASDCEPARWATLVGSWTGDCSQIIELHGGVINKYLGDGFLAIWPAKVRPTEHVAGALGALLKLQRESTLPFRLALHYGEVSSGGGRTLGEDNLSGLELILLFRMEKLAASLGKSFLCTDAAHARLHSLVALASVGEHAVPGYVDEDSRLFYSVTDD